MLAALMERTFRDTYGHNSSPTELEKFVAVAFGAVPQARELADPALCTLLVAHADSAAPVGFAQIRAPGARRAPACVAAARPAELARFYVEQAWHGRGIAAPLMNGCVAAAAEVGADALWLLVYRINARAIAFYRKHDFVAAGTAPFHFGDEIHDDIVMVRALGAA